MSQSDVNDDRSGRVGSRQRWQNAVLATERFIARARAMRRRGRGKKAGKALIEAYSAIRHPSGINFFGRVLRPRLPRKATEQDSRWRNLFRMVGRWVTTEIAGAPVRIEVGDHSATGVSDEEGYVRIELAIPNQPGPEVLDVSLPDHAPDAAPLLVPVVEWSDRSRVVIVSDIDDTLLVSRADRRREMVATALLGNSLTRRLFPGAAALYRALHRGVSAEPEQNPMAYVSGSPWNLHGLLSLIFDRHAVPPGAFFMTDWGFERDQWFRPSHHRHKGGALRQILDWFPDRPLLLIGDSGEEDAAIYDELSREHPDRIAAILIRVVREVPDHLARLEELAEAPRHAGVPFHFFRSSEEAARLLADLGWLTPGQVNDVTRASADKKIHGRSGRRTPRLSTESSATGDSPSPNVA